MNYLGSSGPLLLLVLVSTIHAVSVNISILQGLEIMLYLWKGVPEGTSCVQMQGCFTLMSPVQLVSFPAINAAIPLPAAEWNALSPLGSNIIAWCYHSCSCAPNCRGNWALPPRDALTIATCACRALVGVLDCSYIATIYSTENFPKLYCRASPWL